MSKKEKYYSEEQMEIRSFIKILLILIIIFLALYVFTIKFVDKKKKMQRTNNKGQIQYSEIIIGQMLNREDKEYYVLVFDSEDVNNAYLLNKASSYKSSLNALPLYTADLNLVFNKKYFAENSNYKEDSIENITFKGTTLVKVKNGKIVKFIDDVNLVDKELS